MMDDPTEAEVERVKSFLARRQLQQIADNQAAYAAMVAGQLQKMRDALEGKTIVKIGDRPDKYGDWREIWLDLDDGSRVEVSADLDGRSVDLLIYIRSRST